MGFVLGVGSNSVALLGILICIYAGVSRATGGFYRFGFETRTLFIVGIALMVMGCLGKLHRLERNRLD